MLHIQCTHTVLVYDLYQENDSLCLFQNGGQYKSLSQQQVPVILQSSDVPGGCNFDTEKTTAALAYVSGELAELEGKHVFFRMKFSQYSSAIPGYTEEAGPFYFRGRKLFITFKKHTYCNFFFKLTIWVLNFMVCCVGTYQLVVLISPSTNFSIDAGLKVPLNKSHFLLKLRYCELNINPVAIL